MLQKLMFYLLVSVCSRKNIDFIIVLPVCIIIILYICVQINERQFIYLDSKDQELNG